MHILLSVDNWFKDPTNLQKTVTGSCEADSSMRIFAHLQARAFLDTRDKNDIDDDFIFRENVVITVITF